MKLHEFLEGLHRAFRPRTYLEVGVDQGTSLALSRVPSIAVDPEFRVTAELRCDLHLVKARSEEFLSGPDPLAHFNGTPLDLAFIDGLHLSEIALLDFENVERLATHTTVVVFDDVLPRSNQEASRSRQTKGWAGDVFKVASVLERHRPDLVCIPVATRPTGALLVLALDPSNRVLAQLRTQLLAELISEDPQEVPPDIKRRSRAANPEEILGASFWEGLVALRDDSRPGAPASSSGVRDLIARDAVGRRWVR